MAASGCCFTMEITCEGWWVSSCRPDQGNSSVVCFLLLSCTCPSCACFLWPWHLCTANFLLAPLGCDYPFRCECELLEAQVSCSSQEKHGEQLLTYAHVSLTQTSTVTWTLFLRQGCPHLIQSSGMIPWSPYFEKASR